MRKLMFEIKEASRGHKAQAHLTLEAEALGLVHWYIAFRQDLYNEGVLERSVRRLHEAMTQFGENAVHRLFWSEFQFERRGYAALNLFTSQLRTGSADS